MGGWGNLLYEQKPKEQKFAASWYKGIVFIKRIEVKKSEHEGKPETFAGMLFEELVTEKS